MCTSRKRERLSFCVFVYGFIVTFLGAVDCSLLFTVFRPSFIFRQSFMRTFTDHICHALDSYAHKQRTNPCIGECAYVSLRREHTINIDIIMCLPCNHNQHIKYYHRWESACKHTHGEALQHSWNRHKLRCAFQCDELYTNFEGTRFTGLLLLVRSCQWGVPRRRRKKTSKRIYDSLMCARERRITKRNWLLSQSLLRCRRCCYGHNRSM